MSALRTEIEKQKRYAQSLKDDSVHLQQQMVEKDTEQVIAAKKYQQEINDLNDQVQMLIVEKQEIEFSMLSQKDSNSKEVRQLKSNLSNLESENMLIKLQNENLANELKSMAKQTDQRCLELIEQRETHKSAYKDLKNTVT